MHAHIFQNQLNPLGITIMIQVAFRRNHEINIMPNRKRGAASMEEDMAVMLPELWLGQISVTGSLVSQLHVLALPLRPPYPIPTCLRDVNQWPHVLLDRACVLWGEGAVREQLRILVQSITSSRLLVSVLSYVICSLCYF